MMNKPAKTPDINPSSIRLNQPVREFVETHQDEAQTLVKRLEQAARDMQKGANGHVANSVKTTVIKKR